MANLYFVGLPYVAAILCVLVGIYRYLSDSFSYSSFSSQLLENQKLFWGSILWHYAIVAILLTHFFAFLIYPVWGAIIDVTALYYSLEIFGLVLSLVGFLAISWLMIRRFTTRRIYVVTTKMDWVVIGLLALQMALGFAVGIAYRWGGMWFHSSTTPWLWSLLAGNPQPAYVSAMPALIQAHFIIGWILIGLFPFSRLVHLVGWPLQYLWRPYQRVIWNRAPRPGPGFRATQG